MVVDDDDDDDATSVAEIRSKFQKKTISGGGTTPHKSRTNSETSGVSGGGTPSSPSGRSSTSRSKLRIPTSAIKSNHFTIPMATSSWNSMFVQNGGHAKHSSYPSHASFAVTHTLSSIPLRVRLLSITLPSAIYNDTSSVHIYKQMGYYHNDSVAYFKLETTLFLSNELTSLYQTVESYARVKTQKYGGSLSLEFNEWIQFNASLADLTQDAYLVFRLLEGPLTHSISSIDETCHDEQPLPLESQDRAIFRMPLFEDSGLLKTDSQHTCYGHVRKRIEESIPYNLPPSYEWLDKRSFKAINRKHEQLEAKKKREFMLEDWLEDMEEDTPPDVHSLSPIQEQQQDNVSPYRVIRKRAGYMLYVKFHTYSCPVYFQSGYVKHSASVTDKQKSGATPSTPRGSKGRSRLNSDEKPVITWSITNKDHIKDTFYDEEENSNPCEHMYATRTLSNLHASAARPNKEELKKIEQIINYTILQPLTDSERILLWRYRYFLKGFEKKALVKFLESVQWESAKSKKEALHLLKEWDPIDPEQCLVLLSDKFDNTEVRNYAVSMLRARATEEDILRVLLQLVQALRYEKKLAKSPLAKLLISRAQKSFAIANYLFWYLQVEGQDPRLGPQYKHLSERLLRKLDHSNSRFSNLLMRQKLLVQELDSISRSLVGYTLADANRKLKNLLRASQSESNETWKTIFETPLPLPLSPDVEITSIVVEKAAVFSSNARPLRIPFVTTTGGRYDVIFKLGDDLRQDQLILQVIAFIYQVLQRNSLDSQLTPYKVLATSLDSGFIQMVSSSSTLYELEGLIAIKEHLKQKNPECYEAAKDAYFKSLCGYTVISFLLGLGDRHMENLLLQDNGRLFHIDFGFILGDQPKRYAKCVKLTSYMLDGLDGLNSDTYDRFLAFCAGCFGIIRRHAHVIINMLYLMIDADIDGISKQGNPRQKIMYVQNNLQLDSDRAEAESYLVNVIKGSAGSFSGMLEDTSHKIAKIFHR